MNPYEPPSTNVNYLPFAKRFWRACGRAMREYRAGLVREKFTHSEHLRTWLSVFILAAIFLLIAGLFLLRFLIYARVIQ